MHSLLFAHQCHIGYYPTLPSWPDLFQFSKNFHIGYYPTLSWPDLFRFSRIFLCLTSHGIVTCRQSATVNPRACARALVQESFPAKPQDLFRAFPKNRIDGQNGKDLAERKEKRMSTPRDNKHIRTVWTILRDWDNPRYVSNTSVSLMSLTMLISSKKSVECVVQVRGTETGSSDLN